MTMMIRRGVLGLAVTTALAVPSTATAQLDPLLYLKRTKPTVLIAVDTAGRMQRDINGDYRDDNVYTRTGALTAQELALGVTDLNTAMSYRRKFVAMTEKSPGGGGSFTADHIEIVGDREPGYTSYDLGTRMSVARRSLIEAVNRNSSVVRFGLLRTRQSAPIYETPAGAGASKWKINEGPVSVTNGAWAAQQATGENGGNKWRITRPIVSASTDRWPDRSLRS